MKLNEKSRVILEAIAEGHSFDQILLRKPDLSYNDIFQAAGEALECLDQPEQNKSYSVEAIRQKHQRAYEKWSMEDDAKLAELFRNRVSVPDIAKKLQRQSGAIHSRLAKLNLVPATVMGR